MSRQQILCGVLAGGCLAFGCVHDPARHHGRQSEFLRGELPYLRLRQEHVANADQPAAFGNPLNAERLRVAIKAHLTARGIQQASDPAAADCIVGYAMGTRQVFHDLLRRLGRWLGVWLGSGMGTRGPGLGRLGWLGL